MLCLLRLGVFFKSQKRMERGYHEKVQQFGDIQSG